MTPTRADRYCVIGNPIAQSRSPEIHARFAEQMGEAIEYTRRLAPLDGFAASVRAFFAEGGTGMNVTAPFKVEAAALADVVSPRVSRAGAANCLRVREGALEAENFDGTGLVRDISANLGLVLQGARVLMLGAGGAARGVIDPLVEAGIRELVIANRTRSRAEALARLFEHPVARVQGIAFEDLAQTGADEAEPFDLVVDATSAALEGQTVLPPRWVYTKQTLAYAMAYGKGFTPFLAQADASGARVADGLGMLVEQAADSYAWWRGQRPQTREVLAALRAQFPLAQG